jgi:hypothetical protein
MDVIENPNDFVTDSVWGETNPVRDLSGKHWTGEERYDEEYI